MADDRPTAVCVVDGEPLVSTLLFEQAEFVCVACGRTYGFLSPSSAPTTRELQKRTLEHAARFRSERDEDEKAVRDAQGIEWEAMPGRSRRAHVAAKWRARHA